MAFVEELISLFIALYQAYKQIQGGGTSTVTVPTGNGSVTVKAADNQTTGVLQGTISGVFSDGTTFSYSNNSGPQA